MKTTGISLNIVCMILGIMGFALSGQAALTPIDGVISFSGSTTMDGTGFDEATQFLSFQDVFVGTPQVLTGDYLGTSGADVTVTPFVWAPTTASTPIIPLWSFVSGGNTYSFDLNVLHQDYASPGGLFLSGLGTAHITGPGSEKKATSGQWGFSAQTHGLSTFTFSSTTRVPVPQVPDGGATLSMLGGVLVGLGLMARKQGFTHGLLNF
jgi:hypothetical protein